MITLNCTEAGALYMLVLWDTAGRISRFYTAEFDNIVKKNYTTKLHDVCVKSF
jgi:hypothetical protein